MFAAARAGQRIELQPYFKRSSAMLLSAHLGALRDSAGNRCFVARWS